MTTSRLIGIFAGIGAVATAFASSINAINPKWGGIVAAVGACITMFTERAQGGVSDPQKRAEAAVKEINEN